MTLSLDHIIIYVHDLETAMNDFQDAGFTANYGGTHADGNTENGLIIFGDGSYIELIALVAGKAYEDAQFKGLLKAQGTGYTGFALQSDNLEADSQAIHERGGSVGNMREGGRARSDGVQLQWKTAQVNDGMSPFIIEDVSARHLRVPQDDAVITHANGATGIHEVLIQADDYYATVQRYSALVGQPQQMRGVARFLLGTSALVVALAQDAVAVPHLVSIYTDYDEPHYITLHGARLALI